MKYQEKLHIGFLLARCGHTRGVGVPVGIYASEHVSTHNVGTAGQPLSIYNVSSVGPMLCGVLQGD